MLPVLFIITCFFLGLSGIILYSLIQVTQKHRNLETNKKRKVLDCAERPGTLQDILKAKHTTRKLNIPLNYSNN